MIEYVLLLVISVSMVLMAKSLFSGMGQFMEGYMGKYVRCLMEHGELPAFGAGTSDINQNSGTSYICAKQFSYTASAGFSSNGSGGSGGSGNGSGSASTSASGSNKNSNSSSNRNRNGENSSASASDGSTSGSSADSIANRERRRRSGKADGGDGGGAGGSNSSYTNGKLRTSDGDDGLSGSNQPRVVGELGKGDGSNSSDSEYGYGYGGRSRRMARGISGKLAEEIEKNSKSAQTSSKLKTAESRIIAESTSTLGPKRSFVKMHEFKVAAQQEEEKSAFSMGKLFKYILVIALIIIIVIFFGGQLLNYSKSD